MIDIKQDPEAIVNLKTGDRVILDGRELIVQSAIHRIHFTTTDSPGLTGIGHDVDDYARAWTHVRENNGERHAGTASHFADDWVNIIREGNYHFG